MIESTFEPDPGTLLDSLGEKDLAAEDAIDAYLDRFIGQYSPEELARALQPRLDRLEGRRGELLLALVEGLAREDLWDALADSIVEGPELSAELTFLALEILEGTGRIESRPILLELREELDDELEHGHDLSTLATQIEDDPNSLPLAIDALSRIDRETRVAIIGELANEGLSPGICLLLESLALQEDMETRSAARQALVRLGFSTTAKRDIEAHRKEPQIIASVIGPIDGEGVGEIGFLTETNGQFSLARFTCDVNLGIVKTERSEDLSSDRAVRSFEEVTGQFGEAAIRDSHAAALLLVSGSAWLRREAYTVEMESTLTAIFGGDFHPHPIFTDLEDGTGDGYAQECTVEDVQLLFARHPRWFDDSALTKDLALEMVLHDGDRSPDPVLDPGPFRVLFEGRILERIELYRRILLWTAAGSAESRPEEAFAARRLAIEMSDPQNAVPGHPFLEQLMIQSLCEAKSRIRSSRSR